jgi:hypothetical protein
MGLGNTKSPDILKIKQKQVEQHKQHSNHNEERRPATVCTMVLQRMESCCFRKNEHVANGSVEVLI